MPLVVPPNQGVSVFSSRQGEIGAHSYITNYKTNSLFDSVLKPDLHIYGIQHKNYRTSFYMRIIHFITLQPAGQKCSWFNLIGSKDVKSRLLFCQGNKLGHFWYQAFFGLVQRWWGGEGSEANQSGTLYVLHSRVGFGLTRSCWTGLIDYSRNKSS